MSQYRLEGDRFVFEEYDRLPTFSSFLPGLAGVKGIPLWVFYTNRGQAINSFGIHHKGNAIMEFNPANTAYENTAWKGFRTFLRKDGEYYEPFGGYPADVKRTMRVEQNRVAIEETAKNGLTVRVTYFVLPEEPIGALVRSVELINEGAAGCTVEGLDGLPKIIPFGIQNGQFKEMSNLFKSWTEIKNIEKYAPFYAMRASSDDSAEVSEIKGGYFYATVADGKLMPVVYDAETIFAYDTSLGLPVTFREQGLSGVTGQKQCFANKVPCGFTPFTAVLQPGESYTHTTYIGYAGTVEQLNAAATRFCDRAFAGRKMERAAQLARELVQDVETRTSRSVFDHYIEQCYLDNFLRGGYPYLFSAGNKKQVVHLFSRKHGDPERDYNFFSTAGEYYSQGNGNFRDVCQNRRNDVFFHPEIGEFNIWSFFSLIQLDGYNPLEIRPCTFRIRQGQEEAARKVVLHQITGNAEPVLKILNGAFTPGQICRVMAEQELSVADEEALVAALLALSEEQLEAGFGEGYWSDHWDYLMDLVENYLSVFPEKKQELLLGRKDYRFYDSPVQVRPRSETYVLSRGKVRQYGSLRRCPEKEAKEDFAADGTNWVKGADGACLETTLFGKLLTLLLTKFLLLDQQGIGIEMEGGKPGWNDAMNGLPGLFGSSIPETLELLRVTEFLEECCLDGTLSGSLTVPKEVAELAERLAELLSKRAAMGSFRYWEQAALLREEYRAGLECGVSGNLVQTETTMLYSLIKECRQVLRQGIAAAERLGDGILPTYLTYEAVEYELRQDAAGNPVLTPYGLPGVLVKRFVCHVVPPFLEGPARLLSCVKGQEEQKRRLHRAIRESDIYDERLKMYKTSGSIEKISMEHGRVRAFTPGWLERESVFLHMEYKYFLGLLRSGLTEEYYEAIQAALIPFLSPEAYGRSTLENSSFLASSVNPDEKVHGRGYVARLSGSTTEMLSMWLGMFLGDGGFFVKDGRLAFALRPRLAEWLFDDRKQASFRLLSRCTVLYENESGRKTYGSDAAKVVRMELCYTDGTRETVFGDTLGEEQAKAVRDGRMAVIRAQID